METLFLDCSLVAVGTIIQIHLSSFIACYCDVPPTAPSLSSNDMGIMTPLNYSTPITRSRASVITRQPLTLLLNSKCTKRQQLITVTSSHPRKWQKKSIYIVCLWYHSYKEIQALYPNPTSPGGGRKSQHKYLKSPFQGFPCQKSLYHHISGDKTTNRLGSSA